MHSILFSAAVVLIGFFYFKIMNLNNYNFYPGKVIGLEKIHSKVSSAGKINGGSYVAIKRDIPNVEYYKNNDTIRYDQGELRLVTNFEVNEEIIVLENKQNDNKTYIYSVFYYWIDYYELVFTLFVFLFILGFIKNFV
ncbi:hypothetical protein [Flavobacterium sp. GCM10023249]|uniref:hypothetical protein n=1 Tax=unclassified Flavobacterium TaxID=196869 RepID=UPI00362055A5